MKRKSNKNLWWLTIVASLVAMLLIAWTARNANAATPQGGGWQAAASFAELCEKRGNENQYYLVLSGAETLTEEAPCLGKWSLDSNTVLVLDQGSWEDLKAVSNQGGTVFLTPSAVVSTPVPTVMPTTTPTAEPTDEPTTKPIPTVATPPEDFFVGGVPWVLTAPYTLTIEGIIPEGKWGVEIEGVETIAETPEQVVSVLNSRSATLWFYPIVVEQPVFVTPPANFFKGGVPWVVPAQANLKITETIPAGTFTVTVQLQDFPAKNVTEIMTVLAGREGTLWFNPAPVPVPSSAPEGFYNGGVPWSFTIMSPLPEVITPTRTGIFFIEISGTVLLESRDWQAISTESNEKEATLWFTADPLLLFISQVLNWTSAMESFPSAFCGGGVPWVTKLNSKLPAENPCGNGQWVVQLNNSQSATTMWQEVVAVRGLEEATLWFTPERQKTIATPPADFCKGTQAWVLTDTNKLPELNPCAGDREFQVNLNGQVHTHQNAEYAALHQYEGQFFSIWYVD